MLEMNPVIGVIYHWTGGLACASCYIPWKGIKRWNWANYWFVQGVFSWILSPILIALIFVPPVRSVLAQAPWSAILLAYFWGAMWGFGGLTFGLTIRYLGIALGYAIALGFCTAFGTLMPPLFSGELRVIVHETSGQVILLGIVVCLLGIFLSGVAGMRKERELTDDQKKSSVQEFNFVKGVSVAVFSGIMSSCFAYGLAAGKPIANIALVALRHEGRADLWQNLPVLVVVLLGGFTTNTIASLSLVWRHKAARELIGKTHVADAASSAMPELITADTRAVNRIPLLNNYVLSALAGVVWYFQFFFYSMGETKMGRYSFSSWTLHMASIIIFSTLWGIALREWGGTSRLTKSMVTLGLAVLVGSTAVVGFGSYLKANEATLTSAVLAIASSIRL